MVIQFLVVILKQINLLSVEQNETISEDSNATTTSTTTSTSSTTTSTSSTTTSTTSTTTSIPIIVQNISDAQNQLTILGLYSGEINNELNNETKAALKEFQRLAGLSVDGILGPKTKAALEKGENHILVLVVLMLIMLKLLFTLKILKMLKNP